MKKVMNILPALLAAALLTTGCDFFRRLAGRPDSKSLAQKAEMIRVQKEAQEAARIARLDSLERVRAHRADSAAVMDSLQQGKERLLGPARFGGLAVADLPSRYYIIVGAFSVWDNASRFCQQMTDKGYPAEIIAFRNGYHAVGVCRTDDVVEIYRSLKELKRQPFCPANIWILSKD